MDANYRDLIRAEFEGCVNSTIDRLSGEDSLRPFHGALLSEEALFWSRFERSFSTSFGQRVIEEVSRIAALASGADRAERQYSLNIELRESQLAAIESHISSLRGNTARPAWKTDLAALRAMPLSGNVVSVHVRSDLWWLRNKQQHFMSIKTVKPNIDQTAEAKRDMLKIALAMPDAKVYFGLYYNPSGSARSDYSWTVPSKIFDMLQDEVVLIGSDYWNELGGPGSYDEILSIAQEVGERTRARIAEYGVDRYS